VTEAELERDARILIESAKHVEPTVESNDQAWRLIHRSASAHTAKTFVRGLSVGSGPGADSSGVVDVGFLVRALRKMLITAMPSRPTAKGG
jgi:hypothetical protein